MNRFIAWWLRQRYEFYIVAVSVLLVAAAGLLSNDAVTGAETAATKAAATTTGRMADLIAERFSQTARQIDDLQHLGARLTDAFIAHREAGVSFLLTELRRATDQPGSMLVNVLAREPAGGLIWATRPLQGLPVQALDFDYYQAIAVNGRDTFIGRPMFSQLSSRFVIPFAAAERDAGGVLRSITIVALDAHNLKPLVTGFDLDPADTITLLREDGVVLAGSRDLGNRDPAADDSPLPRMPANGALDEIGPDPVFHQRSFLAVRRVPNAALYVVVTRNAAEALAPAAISVREVRTWAALVSVMIVLTGILVIVLFRRARAFRESERRLRDLAVSETTLRQIAAGAPVIIGMQDENRRWIYLNGAVEDIFGLSPGHCMQRAAGFTVLPEDRPMLAAAFDELAKGGGPRLIEVRSRKPDGSVIWIETLASSFVVPNAGGKPTRRFVTILRDITGRKLAEMAIRDAREEIATLLQNSPGAIYKKTFHPNGDQTTAVVNGTERLGYDAATASMPGFVRDRTSHEDWVRREAALSNCLRDGAAIIEYEMLAASGEWRWLRETMNRAEPDGDAQVIVGFVCDITADRRVKRDQAQSERLAGLGTVATGIAHELNQPLAGIMMAAENGLFILENPDLDRCQAAAKFRRIIGQFNRIAEVVDHIRRVGDPPAAVAEPFTMAEAMHGVMILTGQRLKAEGVTIACDFPADLPPIQASCVLFEQVLMHMILNAGDAYGRTGNATAGVPLPRMVVVSASADDGMVHIRIADAAGGIAPDVLDRIFDPFVTTKPGKGMGLGLSISFATVTEAGGRISARNENGGAVFDIRMPAAAA
jgi:PAS domain S-box-containing protein